MCDHTTADVQRALSELFLTRVGPLLVVSNGTAAAAPAAPVDAAAAAVKAAAVSPLPPPAVAVFGESLL